MNNISSSQLARKVATDLWGTPNTQKKIAKGVYRFDTPGHGGLVAVIDEANIDPHYVEAARRTRHTERVFVQNTGGRNKLFTSVMYDLDSVEDNTREVWVGEEDCEWSTLAYASDDIRQGIAKEIPGQTSATVLQQAIDTAMRWERDFMETVLHTAKESRQE